MDQAHGLPPRQARPQWRKRLPQFLRWGVLLLVLWAAGDIAYGLFTLPPLPSGGFDPSRPSMVYAADGKPVGPLSGDVFRIPVGLDQMPDHVPQAFVASEDMRFYEHGAIDPKGIARALWNDVKSGSIQEGGSTITQQVAKLTFLTSRQTLRRKVQDVVLAFELEHRFSKDEILGIYLNENYMGNGAYGVGAAAKLYFNKDVKDLTLGEAAALAGINPAPESYNPLRKPDVALRQRNIVLDRMVAAGYLTTAQADQEKAKPLKINRGKVDLKNPYPWYMDAVRAELKDRYGLDERAVDLMGLKIYTGLAPNLQRAAENALSAKIFPASAPDGLEGAFAAVDPRTGEIRALVGGRTYTVSGLNRATDAQVSPGSAFKPVMVFGPAFEYGGLTPDSKIDDSPLDIGGWTPQNWDHKFHGQVTVREAARESWNIPAIRMLQAVGVEKAKSFARNLGIPFSKEDTSLTLALGSMAHGLSPLDMAGAYQAFANGGVYYQPHLIVKVEAADGVLSPDDSLDHHRAMKAKTAYQVTDILKTVVQSGTGTGALLDRPMAGKTGSVELPDTPDFQGKDGNTAAWFVGYTPDLVGAVWLGYDQTDKDHFLPAEVNGSTYPTRIWRQAVGAYMSGRTALPFPGADGRLPAPAPKPAPAEPAKPAEPAVTLPAVKNVTAEPGTVPGTINLRWEVEGNPPAEGMVLYQVLRSTTPDLPVDAGSIIGTGPGMSAVDIPPGPGTYYYRVVAMDPASKQLGTPSPAVQVVLPVPAQPGQAPAQPPGTEQPPGTAKPPDTTQPPGTTQPGQPTQPGEPPAQQEPPSTQPAPPPETQPAPPPAQQEKPAPGDGAGSAGP